MVGEIKLRPVEGKPPAQSAPSDRKASWKESVRKAVPSDAAFLGDRPLRVRIDFYLKGKPPRNKLPDVDNMTPPILNALEGSRDDRGSLYADDNTVEEICAAGSTGTNTSPTATAPPTSYRRVGPMG